MVFNIYYFLSGLNLLPKIALRICSVVVFHMTRFVLVISFVVALAHHLGWIHRFVWHSLERELSKILNDTPVSAGSVRYDLLRGKVWVTNLVLHSPQRRKWKWQSPVMGRVGKLYCECNLVQVLFFEWFVREVIPLEIYTIEASDIQAFVERKHHVFNFYLMDPHVDVPDPPGSPTSDQGKDDGTGARQPDDIPINTNLSEDPAAMWNGSNVSGQNQNQDLDDSDRGTASSTAGASTASTAVTTSEQEKAQKLVDDMVRALGRATQHGSLHGALIESRDRLKSQLKQLQTTSTKQKSQTMQEGVQIIQQVSKSLVEKSQSVPQIVLPARKSIPHLDDKIVYARIGRVVLNDARIFTRDHQFVENSNG